VPGDRSISHKSSRAIFEDALAAYETGDHPCHLFRNLQIGVADNEWQLPEPFNGRSAQAGIVFLGLNPSYDPKESVPRVRATFAEWDGFYRGRFEGPTARWHKLYRRYQLIGELATSNAFRLGTDAIVLELIRFRSAAGAGCHDPAVLEHELPMTGRLLEELAPRVLVANGGAALWGIQMLWPTIQKALPFGVPLLSVEHQEFAIESSWGRVTVVPTRHLSAAFGFRLDMLPRLAHAVASGLSA
jgi:hypothetical protein